MPKRFDNNEARQRLVKLGYRATEPYPGSSAPWAATCLSCGESVVAVYCRVRVNDRPQCSCRRAIKAAASQARGRAKVAANAAGKAAIVRAHDWIPLEPYPGGREPWPCLCQRCGQEGAPILHHLKRSRGCRSCSGWIVEITPEIADKVMRQSGWIPQVPFPGPREPWPCACQACGRLSRPRYEAVKSQKSGCKLCAMRESGRIRRARFAPTAIKTMREASLDPQVPFPGAARHWLCRCLRCGNFTSPTYGNVASGGRGCETCRRQSQGRAKRDRFADEATQRLRDAGYQPLKDYPGAGRPWLVKCRCGNETSLRIGAVDNGQRGCRACAESGFNADKPAVVYLLEHSELQALKIGVTGIGTVRIPTFCKHGWLAVVVEQFTQGIDALRVEDAILTWWRKDLGLPLYLASNQTPIGGWTETVDANEMSAFVAARRVRTEVAAIRSLRRHMA